MSEDPVVAVVNGIADYPREPPFDPPNPLYDAVSRLLGNLGLDRAHEGTAGWNPLGALVRPGQHVVIKPNLVSSRNFHQRYDREDFLCSCTHPSVIRPLIDLAWRALDGRGRISIAETPLEGGDLPTTLAALGVSQMIDTLRQRDGINIDLIDLRDFQLVPRMVVDDQPVAGRSLNLGYLRRRALSGDPLGYVTVDLAGASSFAAPGVRVERLRFHHSNPGFPSRHHSGARHEYSIAKTVLASDLLINMPKMKTHKKTGVTLGMKNMFGISNQKYWLPHFAAGAPPLGDAYPVAPPPGARLATFFSRIQLPGGHALVIRFPPRARREEPYIYDGNWSGNDTLWRTILDLNRIVFHADSQGRMHETPQRQVLTIIDGIVAGEGNGPLAASPKRCGLVIGGLDTWACDYVATRMMGVDPAMIRSLSPAAAAGPYPVTRATPESIRVVPAELAELRLDFELPRGWLEARAPGRQSPGRAGASL